MAQVKFTDLNGNFDPNRPTYMITHGFLDDSEEPWVDEMATNLIQRDPDNPNDDVDANVTSVDWRDAYQGINYWEARDVTVTVGNEIANYLIDKEADPDTTQLIGHSLGAHVSGIAGDHYDEFTGSKIDTIIGLDSAGPGYESGSGSFPNSFLNTVVDTISPILGYSSGGPDDEFRSESKRLDETDANRVVTFHTTEILGYDDPHGELDLFVNPPDFDQPGTLTFIDDHSYAHQLYSQLLEGQSFDDQPEMSSVGSEFNLSDVENRDLMGSVEVNTFSEVNTFPDFDTFTPV